LNRGGILHNVLVTGGGFASRYDWAKLILDLDPKKGEQKVKEILPARTSDFPTPAQRPLFSALDCNYYQATFGLRLPDWMKALTYARKVFSHPN
jgi:dTDP-4-dehydrorhamnose reductase